MRSYGMEGVSIRRRGSFWSLEVPGLAEQRPSLVPGDYIAVSNHFQNDAQPYEVIAFSRTFKYLLRIHSDKLICFKCY
jgi:hypothetical protein